MKELIEKRLEAQNKLKALAALETAFTDDQQKEWDQLKAEIQDLDTRIARMQEVAESEAEGHRQAAQASGTPATPPVVPGVQDGPSGQEARDVQGFSFLRAVAAAANPRQTLDGLEAEMAQEAQREAAAAGVPLDNNAVGIPQVVLEHSGRRAQNNHSATGGTGGNEGGVLIQTEVRPFIDILMEAIQLRQLGATFLSGLQGNLKMPRAIRSATKPGTPGENGTATEMSVTFGSFDLSPKRIAAFLKVSKQLLLQTSPSVEAYLRNYLATEMALKVDALALTGSGTGDEPLGLLNQTGINKGNLGANGGFFGVNAAIDMQTRMKESKARPGDWKYLITPQTEGKLKKTFVDNGSNAERIIDRRNPGMLEGYGYEYSHFLPTDGTKGTGTDLQTAILAKWSSMLLAQWGGFELITDPYTGSKEGLINLVGATYMDTNVEHPEEFEVHEDINLTATS